MFDTRAFACSSGSTLPAPVGSHTIAAEDTPYFAPAERAKRSNRRATDCGGGGARSRRARESSGGGTVGATTQPQLKGRAVCRAQQRAGTKALAAVEPASGKLRRQKQQPLEARGCLGAVRQHSTKTNVNLPSISDESYQREQIERAAPIEGKAKDRLRAPKFSCCQLDCCKSISGDQATRELESSPPKVDTKSCLGASSSPLASRQCSKVAAELGSRRTGLGGRSEPLNCCPLAKLEARARKSTSCGACSRPPLTVEPSASSNTNTADCAKCQLLFSWTLAQSKIISNQQQQKQRERLETKVVAADEQVATRVQAESQLPATNKIAENEDEDEQVELSSLSSTEADEEEERKQAQIAAEKEPDPSDKNTNTSNSSAGKRRRPAPNNNNNNNNNNNYNNGATETRNMIEKPEAERNLLEESEVSAIELFLKSHKSSVYVCGCMANLYFTKTHLVDNGRSSQPEPDGWRLNKTGIPVLVFDSGLAKNRQRKKLSISLAERGSGFILWSDTIDHLSDYRAFNSLEQADDWKNIVGRSKSDGTTIGRKSCNSSDTTFDSFHVMYLSSNHRIMVGLSFDDAICARLFLAQIELVCSDPANIALNGPKSRQNPRSSQQKSGAKPVLGNCKIASSESKCVSIELDSSQKRATDQMVIMSRFLSSFRRPLGLRVSTRRAHHQNHHTQLQSAFGSGSWSTLRRGMRLGRLAGGASSTGQQEQQQQQQQLTAEEALLGELSPEVTSGKLDERTRQLVAAFKPRPLAQLAAAGQNWRKQMGSRGPSGASLSLLPKRRPNKMGAQLVLPQKCDISAPCLFQHVVNVDSQRLSTLHSRALVAHKSHKTTSNRPQAAVCHLPPQPPPRSQLVVLQQTNPRPQSQSPPTINQISHLQQSCSSSGSVRSIVDAERSSDDTLKSNLNADSALAQKQVSVAKSAHAKSKSSSLSSSSSCYSSASISPASSEYGAQQQQRRLMNEHMARRKLAATNGSNSGLIKSYLMQQRRPPIPPPDPPRNSALSGANSISKL